MSTKLFSGLRMLGGLTVASLVLAVSACAAGPRSKGDSGILREEVLRTERAFAATMAQRNFAGFASFLTTDSVFFDGATALAGPAAIEASWKSLYDGAQAPFSWEPTTVVVLESGKLALSTGPVHAPDGKVIAQFNSIWRRELPGVWKVVFDKGCSACLPIHSIRA